MISYCAAIVERFPRFGTKPGLICRLEILTTDLVEYYMGHGFILYVMK